VASFHAVSSNPAGSADAVRPVPDVDVLLARIAALEETVTQLGATTQGHGAWLADLHDGIAALPVEFANLHADNGRNVEWLNTLERWVRSCVRTLAQFGAQPLGSDVAAASGTPDIATAVWQRLDVWATMLWIKEAAVVDEGPLVSVVTATIDRPQLRQAVESVLAQSYRRLEVVIVDDSPRRSASNQLQGLKDERLRIVQMPEHPRQARAYNTGLDAAQGEIICALDDDNIMHRQWLRSVVWAFNRYPEAEALYGARVNEDPGAKDAVPSGMPPTLEFQRYDRRRHERANYVDRNTIAFRAAHRVIRYDDSLPSAVDWDHSLRLFAAAPPLALPAIACYYRTLVPGRISDGPRQSEGVRTVRSRSHLTRPLHVHVHTEMYPVISETYITEDINTLEDSGAVVTVSSMEAAVSVAEDAPPCRLDFEDAIAEAAPDVVLMHWGTHAEVNLKIMERLETPFACRLHTFDVNADMVAQLLAHPLCVAVYAHPHHIPLLPEGVLPMMPVVSPRTVIPSSPATRDLVLSVSAGLPKRDFPLVIEAMARLPEHERMIIIARTNGVLELPEQVQRLVAERDARIRVLVNASRRDSLAAMARASVMLYALRDDSLMGFPMCIVEAMLCGVIVIAPDRPEARDIVGEHLRTYRVVDDIVGHVRAVAMGGAAVAQARAELQERARRHRDPAQLRFLYDSLRDELTAWKLRQV
jgi:glycosyltransferase involved in cell wall biosynthesis